MNAGLSLQTSRRCILRSGMLNAAYNARGLQSLGFLYAMLPGLREIYPDDADFARSCARYSAHFNCHVIWAPFLCGAFLHTERQIASGALGPEMVDMLKETTLNSLSAVGDSFVSGSLLVSLMLIFSCLALLGSAQAILAAMLACMLYVLVFRFISFYFGVARGFNLLRHIRALNLINKSDYLKLFNAVLLTALLALALDFPGPPGDESGLAAVALRWFIPLSVMMVLSYAASRLRLSRSLSLTAIMACAFFFI